MPRKKRGHAVEVTLIRSPLDGRNGVCIDGEKLDNVTKVEIVGEAGKMPRVRITMVPNVVTARLGDATVIYRAPTKKV